MTDHNQCWSALADELERWRSENRCATFWWRDDDACKAGPKFERLVEISTANRAPLALGVIPALLKSNLVPPVVDSPCVTAMQHGYSHTNYAPVEDGVGAWELGTHRGLSEVLREAKHGSEIMRRAFGERSLPVMVAPWNRIAPELFPGLRELGFCGASASGVRAAREPVDGLRLANIHCDLLKWKGGEPRFRTARKVALELVEHLSARRTGSFDRDEATGILTHHVDLDEDSWQFLEQFVKWINSHPAGRWVHPWELFGQSRNEDDTSE